MHSFRMAHADKPDEIIEATKQAVIDELIRLVSDLRNDIKQPGLTWDQINSILEQFRKARHRIHFQERPM